MRVKINATIGMYYYLEPVLQAWAARYNYRMPADTVVELLEGYYYDEFDKPSIRGDHYTSKWERKSVVRIRPGIKDELQTWAHEFAHFIQSYNLLYQWHSSYDAQTKVHGYWDNKYEREAREAGDMANVFYIHGWLKWDDFYSVTGEYSTWSKIKSKSMGMSLWSQKYEWECSWVWCEWHESDWVTFITAMWYLHMAATKEVMKYHGQCKTFMHAIINMQQYAV